MIFKSKWGNDFCVSVRSDDNLEIVGCQSDDVSQNFKFDKVSGFLYSDDKCLGLSNGNSMGLVDCSAALIFGKSQ